MHFMLCWYFFFIYFISLYSCFEVFILQYHSLIFIFILLTYINLLVFNKLFLFCCVLIYFFLHGVFAPWIMYVHCCNVFIVSFILFSLVWFFFVCLFIIHYVHKAKLQIFVHDFYFICLSVYHILFAGRYTSKLVKFKKSY